MRYRDTHKSLKALYAVAATQGGYFTAKQAAATGYDYTHLVYHLQAGNFERAAHGLYRLPTIPLAEHDDLIRLSLWSRGRDDAPQAIVSHASALFLHQLSDVLPAKVHLTVPPTFRKAAPRGCLLHKSRLTAAEIEAREGFAVTRPLRTLRDAARDAGITDEQLARAIGDATRRGLVRESVLKHELSQAMSPARRERFASLIG
jgi:predicted transcriptional regulator of viral defense system